MAETTSFTSLYPLMRAILGDRAVHGNWAYDTVTLDSALRAVVITGFGPTGYRLDGPDPFAATAITPELKLGDDAALMLYDTCLLLIAGEDGALSYTTRSLSVRDGGDRKRDLMSMLELRVREIRDGDAVFATFQSLAQFVNALPHNQEGLLASAAQLGGITVHPIIGDIAL